MDDIMATINSDLFKMTTLRSWCSDLFILRNPEVDKYIAEKAEEGIKSLQIGEIGKYTDKKGKNWYIAYNFCAGWYRKVEEIIKEKKNPIIELGSYYREEAFNDGSYYKIMDDE